MRSESFGVQPRARRRLTSSSLRGVPSGLDASNTILRLRIDDVADHLGQLANAEIFAGADVDVRFAVVVLHQEHARRARSSTWRNSRRGRPLPQTDTSAAPDSFASWNLRISAGSTCELFRSKLSFGPYRFVGIAEMKSQPYWRR